MFSPAPPRYVAGMDWTPDQMRALAEALQDRADAGRAAQPDEPSRAPDPSGPLSNSADDGCVSGVAKGYPTGDALMAEVFDNLSRAAPNRPIDMKVFRPDFFAVAGGGDRYRTYARYIATSDGVVGFTASWRTDYFPNGNRVAVVKAKAKGYLESVSHDVLESAALAQSLAEDAERVCGGLV